MMGDTSEPGVKKGIYLLHVFPSSSSLEAEILMPSGVVEMQDGTGLSL